MTTPKLRLRMKAAGPGPHTVHVHPTAELTETGTAAKLVHTHGSDLRYCHLWGRWLVWTGTHWTLDDTGEVHRRARSVVDETAAEGARMLGGSENERKRGEALIAHARRLYKARGIAAALEIARSMVPVTPAELDTDPWLLSVGNGTIDLRTGELREHRREDLITHWTTIDYDREALCPRWMKFLSEVTDGREELQYFLQRIAGYCLTGSIREHALFLLIGSGANGKSIFAETLQFILGDLAIASPPGILMLAKGERHPTELRRLFGRRLVVTNEVPKGASFSEERIKDLTGGTKVSARGMREDFSDFDPTHKLLVCANDLPRVRDTSEGFWRRMRVVPFDASFRGREDRSLPEQLRAEASGILRWAVEGTGHWLAEGLGEPLEVQQATGSYRDAEDLVGRWLADWRDEQRQAPVWVASKDLLAHHKAWSEEGSERALTAKALGAELTRRAWTTERRTIDGKTERVWVLP